MLPDETKWSPSDLETDTSCSDDGDQKPMKKSMTPKRIPKKPKCGNKGLDCAIAIAPFSKHVLQILGEFRPNKKYTDTSTAPKVWSSTGSWDSDNYIRFLKMVIKKEKEEIKEKDPYYGGQRKEKKWIQDNAPCHCSLKTRKFIQKARSVISGY